MKKLILMLSFLVFVLSPLVIAATVQAQNTNVTLYAGEITTSQYGFGNSSTTITSPGPTLTLISGQKVTVTLQNAGANPHNFAIVSTKSSTSNVLWSSAIKSADNPLSPGSSASVTFTVGDPGNYYYICQVDGHVNLGMWGNVIVLSAIPEFPLPLLIVFIA
ncbi:MAG: plastocyanin/azurin family copper-binding protein, partial [Bacillota bacterium]